LSQKINNNEGIYTVKQFAAALQVSEWTVYHLIKLEQIHARQIGRQWRIPGTELQKYQRSENEQG
jgi:excisionase family DNA binding protein